MCSVVDQHSWDYWENLSEEVLEELAFWRDNVRSLNGHSFEDSLGLVFMAIGDRVQGTQAAGDGGADLSCL